MHTNSYILKWLVFAIISITNVLSQEPNWNYKDPSTWSTIESSYSECGSTRQSPINIVDKDAKCDKNNFLKPLNINVNSYRNLSISYLYNGRYLIASPTDSKVNILISGSGLPTSMQPFKLIHFHFHWGKNSNEGSEHKIDGKQYPLEMHIPFVSTVNGKYLAVIVVLFEVQAQSNPKLNDIFSSISQISTNATETSATTIDFNSLFPSNTDNYYYYEGSQTSPPCTEAVFFIVMKNKIGISESQLSVFRKDVLKPNSRPLQPLNNRIVLKSICKRSFFDLFNFANWFNF